MADLNRIGHYLAVPLRTAPLLLIAIFALLFLIAFKAGLLGIWLGFVLLSGFLNYGFILLDSVAGGEDEPPVLSVEMMNPLNGGRWLMMLVIAGGAFFVSDAAGYWFGPTLAKLLGFAVAMFIPAMIAVQGATGSVVQSFNLLRCWRLMLRLGVDYLLIVVCVALFWLLAHGMLRGHVDLPLPLIVRIALLLYGWLATFAVIGGVLHERRDDLMLDDADAVEEFDEPEDVAAIERERDRQVDRIYAEWRGGAHTNAWKSVLAQLERADDPLVDWRWMYQRIARWPDPLLANRLAQEFLPRLLAAKRHGEALDLARERIKAYPEFRTSSAAELIQLARLARDAGDRPTARTLLRNFQQFYAADPLRPVAEELLQQITR